MSVFCVLGTMLGLEILNKKDIDFGFMEFIVIEKL